MNYMKFFKGHFKMVGRALLLFSLKFQGDLFQTWQDYRFTWDDREWLNVESLKIRDSTSIWVPDLVYSKYGQRGLKM